MRLNTSDAKIYVAGHCRMVGSAIWTELEAAGYTNLVGRISGELNLRDPNATQEFFEMEKLDVVVLAVARVGGILANECESGVEGEHQHCSGEPTEGMDKQSSEEAYL